MPLSMAISCGSTKETTLKNLPLHAYFIDKEIQDSKSRKHIDLTRVTRKEINTLPPNILGTYNSKMVSGTFIEPRKFYREGIEYTGWHTGIDVMLPINQKIFAPVNGKVLASYWIKNETAPFASGIGGVIVMEANIQDLDVPNDYKKFIYLFKDEWVEEFSRNKYKKSLFWQRFFVLLQKKYPNEGTVL